MNHPTLPETTPESSSTVAPRNRRLGRLGAVAGAGVIAGLFAVGATTFASAQTDTSPTPASEAGVETVVEAENNGGLDLGDVVAETGHETMSFILDECLEGVLEGHFEGNSAVIDDEAMEAAFDECGVPDDIEGGVVFDGPVDEAFEAELDAVFGRFDECLDGAVPGGLAALDSQDAALDETAVDAAFESCEPILDELPDNVMVDTMFDGDMDIDPELEAELDAAFEEFDACLDAAVPGGLDAFESGAELDEAAVDAAYESCDAILDGLPAEAFFVVEGDIDDFGFEFEFDCDPDASSEEGGIENDGADDEGTDA